MRRFMKKDKGFTLIEVMLVVLIIGIIAIIALPKLLVTKVTAEEKSCLSNLQALRTASEQFMWDTGAYSTANSVPNLIIELQAVHAVTLSTYLPADSSVSGVCPTAPVAPVTENYAYDGAGSITCAVHP